MSFSVYVLAVGASLMSGVSHSPAASSTFQQPAKTTDVTRVGFIDNLLQGGTARRAKPQSHQRKHPSAKGQAETSEARIPGTIPIPLPKPTDKNPVSVPASRTPNPRPEQTPATKDQAPDHGKEGEAKDPPSQNLNKPDINQSKDQNDAPTEHELPSNEADNRLDIAPEDPGELKACLSKLNALGTRYANISPIDEGNGCGIEHPIEVSELLPGLSLGGAVMRCQTALGMAHWLKNTVQPALDIARPGRKIVSITPGTTFACRLRNNAPTGMISEHARGNAFDVAAFKFDNGETMEMKPRQDDHTIEGAFQKATTAGACLYFTTVLAPGSDAAHETHLHVDIKDRNNGYRICESL